MDTNKQKLNSLEKKNYAIKEELYAIIKEELKKCPRKKFHIDGELWDGTEIRYIRLNSEGVVVISGLVSDFTCLWGVASTEDLLWIAGEMVD